jgi:transglutaminase-like putative cysteine protease
MRPLPSAPGGSRLRPFRLRSQARPEEAAVLRAALPWVLAALALAIGPVLLQLPAWFALPLLAPLLLRAGLWRAGRDAGVRHWLPLLVVGAVAVAAVYMGRGAAAAVVGGFALVLALKALEACTRRDALLLLFAACVLAALGAIRSPGAVALVLVLLLAPVLLAALAALHGHPRPLGGGGGLLALALPPALALFVLVPRVPGPLWDFGLALGLPIAVQVERSAGSPGAEAGLEPGRARAGGGGGDGTALVARFENWVPPVSRLYWRGPVYWAFDGRAWLPAPGFGERGRMMAEGFRKPAQWTAEWRSRGTEVAYSLRLAPHGGNWLYALDLPDAPVQESYLTRDYQLLSMTPLRAETSYRAVARFDARIGQTLDEARRAAALSFPAGANPRIEALGRQLAAGGTAPHEIAAAGLDHFARGGYRFNDRVGLPDGADHPYDAFMFERREGGADLLAASFALTMRAAGVPARLVAGFRGGRLMALTDYVLVKESNAHVWTELWFDDQGWVRFDPVDVVAPQRFDGKPRAAAAPAPAPQAVPRSADGAQAAHTMAEAAAPDGGGRDWLAGLDKWVIRYDASRQSELLAVPEGGSLGWLLAALVGALGGLAGVYRAGAAWLQWRAEDPVQRAWRRFMRELARGGVAVDAATCPHALAARLDALPDGGVAAGIARLYAALRYGDAAPGDAARLRRVIHHFRLSRTAPGEPAR